MAAVVAASVQETIALDEDKIAAARAASREAAEAARIATRSATRAHTTLSAVEQVVLKQQARSRVATDLSFKAQTSSAAAALDAQAAQKQLYQLVADEQNVQF
jgi:hypothetical protein